MLLVPEAEALKVWNLLEEAFYNPDQKRWGHEVPLFLKGSHDNAILKPDTIEMIFKRLSSGLLFLKFKVEQESLQGNS